MWAMTKMRMQTARKIFNMSRGWAFFGALILAGFERIKCCERTGSRAQDQQRFWAAGLVLLYTLPVPAHAKRHQVVTLRGLRV